MCTVPQALGTGDELMYVIEKKKMMVLVKMCDEYLFPLADTVLLPIEHTVCLRLTHRHVRPRALR